MARGDLSVFDGTACEQHGQNAHPEPSWLDPTRAGLPGPSRGVTDGCREAPWRCDLWWMTLISCQPDDPTDDDGTGPEAPFETEVGDWEDCGEGTECAGGPGAPVMAARTRDLHVRRLLPPAEATRVLWYVDGGPGDAGTQARARVRVFSRRVRRSRDLRDGPARNGRIEPARVPGPAGSGGSGGATITEEEWPACVASLDPEVLPAFSTEQAAEDLATVIPLVTDGLDTVFLATSYGTFLAQRALERHPDLVSAAILDGLVPADWTFAEFDGSMDATGRTYLGLCDDDPVCAAELGGDAVAFAETTLAGLDAAPCAGLDRAQARALLGALLLTGRLPRRDARRARPARPVRRGRRRGARRARRLDPGRCGRVAERGAPRERRKLRSDAANRRCRGRGGVPGRPPWSGPARGRGWRAAPCNGRVGRRLLRPRPRPIGRSCCSTAASIRPSRSTGSTSSCRRTPTALR